MNKGVFSLVSPGKVRVKHQLFLFYYFVGCSAWPEIKSLVFSVIAGTSCKSTHFHELQYVALPSSSTTYFHLAACSARNLHPSCAYFNDTRRPAVGVEPQLSDNNGRCSRGPSLVEHAARRLMLRGGSRVKRGQRRPCVFEDTPEKAIDCLTRSPREISC